MRRTLLIVGSAVFVAASIAVLSAQHRPPGAHHPLQLMHSLCGEPAAAGQTAKAHVPEHLAKMLELSSAQLADIERIAGEACEAMRRTHDNILQVLTPDQRAKVRELHGGD